MDKTLIAMALVGTLSLWLIYFATYYWEKNRKDKTA